MYFHPSYLSKLVYSLGYRAAPQSTAARTGKKFCPLSWSNFQHVGVQGKDGSTPHKVTQGPRLLLLCCPASLKITIQKVDSSSLESHLGPSALYREKEGGGQEASFLRK